MTQRLRNCGALPDCALSFTASAREARAHYHIRVRRPVSLVLSSLPFLSALSPSLSLLSFDASAHSSDSSIILGRQMTRPPKSNERQRGCRRARLVNAFRACRSSLLARCTHLRTEIRRGTPSLLSSPSRENLAEFHRYAE